MLKIEIPKNCPSCGYTLELVGDQLFCRNTACESQLGKKVEHFTKTLGILGFGPKTIEKLKISDITEVFFLGKEETTAILGEKTAVKLLDEIERARSADLSTVLAAFSIPLIGVTAAKKIADVVTSIDEITFDKCKEAGLGEKATANLMCWLDNDFTEIREFLPFTFKSNKAKGNNANTKRVCITGKLANYKKKSDAEASLLAAGFTLVDNVTKTTDYLVDEEGKMSGKREKAVQYGITIITDINVLLKEKI